MQKKQERELTAAEATGPITKATFWRRAVLFLRVNSIESPPVVKVGTPEFAAWHQYFVRRLGGVPWVFKAAIEGQREEVTLPTVQPAWFDLGYVEDPAWVAPKARNRYPSDPPALRANCFVADGAPSYAAVMVIHETTTGSPARFETRMCSDGVTRRGIWVPYSWLPEKRRTRSSFKAPPRPNVEAPADDFIPFGDPPAELGDMPPIEHEDAA